MSKFNKKKKDMPAVNTASLPDIVFMLLFFFMVTTVMKDTDLLIKQQIPKASEIKKLEQKKLVSYIYVGKSKDGKFGDVIQLNDKIAEIKDIRNFILDKRSKVAQNELPRLTTSIKADIKNEVGTIFDIKKELREIEALKINYSANPSARIQ
ncbi:MAG: biopolymer transporter ExbD [Flavobacteriaceae bacterium]|nr:biopolymer transporter ExbD [Flavobacteriaceae bacterium]